jgi:hypothetical protein
MNHRDLADLVSWLYGSTSYEPEERTEGAAIMVRLLAKFPTLRVLYVSNPDAIVVFAIVRIDNNLNVVYRGSYTGRDWILDALVKETDPKGRPSIKQVHSGFYGGTVEASDIVMMFYRIGDRIIIIGHSLGASRGGIEAEHLVAIGILPHLVVLWAPPAAFKPSDMPAPKYPLIMYRNLVNHEEDPVTYSTDIVGYEHRAPWVDVSAPPANPKWWDPFDLHHFALYASVTPATEIP